jgi:hypothetical protein
MNFGETLLLGIIGVLLGFAYWGICPSFDIGLAGVLTEKGSS